MEIFQKLFTFLAITIFLHTFRTLAFVISGAEYKDLEYTGSSLTNEINSWSTTFGNCTSQCGSDYFMGGPSCWNGTGQDNYSSYAQRTFTDLPVHDIVYLTFKLYLLGSWDPGDNILIDINGTKYLASNFSSVSPAYYCPSSNIERNFVHFLTKQYHNSSSLTLTLYNRANFSSNKSIGLHNLHIVFKNSSSPPEVPTAIVQGGTAFPSVGNWTIRHCNISQYAGCYSCDPSCHSCYGANATSCLSCSSGYYYSNGSCKPCHSTCRTCSDYGAKFCTSCFGDSSLYPDNSCRTQCSSWMTLSGGPPYTCKCTSQYFYADGTCSSCPNSTYTKQGELCVGPCPIGFYYYSNGSCLGTCDMQGFSGRNEKGNLFCDFECLSTKYLDYDSSCESSCDDPYVPIDLGGYKYCASPCGENLFYYSNKSCLPTCDGPFEIEEKNGYKKCNFLCDEDEFYFANGTCLDICPTENGFTPQNLSVGIYCEFKCKQSEYFHQNGTCIAKCEAPFISQNITVGGYCNCPENSFLYANNTCLPYCDSPMTIYNVSTGKLCSNPCERNEYLFPNGSCLPDCRFSYNPINTSIGAFCNPTCRENQFYASNNTCLDSCEAPLVANYSLDMKTCNFPCEEPSPYYYPNSSICHTDCPLNGAFSFVNSSLGTYCYFKCSNGSYYYSNGTCSTSCPNPYLKQSFIYGSFCNFPCLANQYYGNTSQSCLEVCMPPHKQLNTSTGKFCLESPVIITSASAANNTVKVSFIATTIVTVPLIFLGGNPYMAMNAITFLQSINFISCYNIMYPGMLVDLLRATGTMGMMRFLPNPFEWFTTLPNVEPPESFKHGGYDGLFFVNEGKLLFVSILLGICYCIGLMITKLGSASVMPIHNPSGTKGNLLSNMSRGIVFRLSILFYSDVVTSVWLQLMDFDTNSSATTLSSVFAVAFLVLSVALPVYIARVLSTNPKELNSDMDKYQCFIEDYDMNRDLGRYFIVLILAKRFFTQTSLVLLCDSPKMQIGISWLLNTIMLGIYFIYKPHHNLVLNIFDMMNEFCLFLINGTAMVMLMLEKESKYFDAVNTYGGYFIFFTAAFMMVFGLLNVFRENIAVIISIFKKYGITEKNPQIAPERKTQSPVPIPTVNITIGNDSFADVRVITGHPARIGIEQPHSARSVAIPGATQNFS